MTPTEGQNTGTLLSLIKRSYQCPCGTATHKKRFTKVYALKGGWNGWVEAHYPTDLK